MSSLPLLTFYFKHLKLLFLIFLHHFLEFVLEFQYLSANQMHVYSQQLGKAAQLNICMLEQAEIPEMNVKETMAKMKALEGKSGE